MIPNDSQMTPLHTAARRGLLEICRLLFNDSKVKHTFDNHNGGVPPFHFACMSGSREVCEMFIRNGAEISSRTTSRNTPLQFASFQGNEEVCKLLIETGNKYIYMHFVFIKRSFNTMRRQSNLLFISYCIECIALLRIVSLYNLHCGVVSGDYIWTFDVN